MPEAGTELINQRPATVVYEGREVGLTSGETRLHAVLIVR